MREASHSVSGRRVSTPIANLARDVLEPNLRKNRSMLYGRKIHQQDLTRRFRARLATRFKARVVLPTPPFGEYMATTEPHRPSAFSW